VELVDNSYNVLTGSDSRKISEAFNWSVNKKSDFSLNLYGNGQAAKIAASEIIAY
jgi:UDP-GlcNAc3NAcA epimerase